MFGISTPRLNFLDTTFITDVLSSNKSPSPLLPCEYFFTEIQNVVLFHLLLSSFHVTNVLSLLLSLVEYSS